MTIHPRSPPPGRLASLAGVPYRALAQDLRTQSLRAVAKRYGVNRNTARWWRRQLGIASPASPAPRGPALQPQILAYLTAHPDGATGATLAQALGDTPLILYRTLRRLETLGLVTRALVPVPGRYTAVCCWRRVCAESTVDSQTPPPVCTLSY